jgi:hypothetical protein
MLFCRLVDELPLPLGDNRLDDLAASCDKTSEKLCRRVRERPEVRLGCLGEMGDHHGIDRIGLGALVQGLRRATHLGLVHHANRQPRRREARRDHRLEASRRFDRNRLGRQGRETGDHRVKTCGVPARAENLAARANRDVALVLRNIDRWCPSSPFLAPPGSRHALR